MIERAARVPPPSEPQPRLGEPWVELPTGADQEGSVLYLDDRFAGYKGSPVRGVARVFTEFRRRSRFRFVKHLEIIAYVGDPALEVDLD